MLSDIPRIDCGMVIAALPGGLPTADLEGSLRAVMQAGEAVCTGDIIRLSGGERHISWTAAVQGAKIEDISVDLAFPARRI